MSEKYLLASSTPIYKQLEFYIKRAITNYDNKDFEKAIQLFTEAIELQKGSAGPFHLSDTQAHEAYWRRGQCYYSLGDYDKAISDCNSAIKFNPNNAIPWSVRGISHDRLGNLQQALEDLDIAIELSPKWCWCYEKRAIVSFGMQDYQRAINDFSMALELEPNKTYLLQALSICFIRQRDAARAIESIQKAIDLDTEDIQQNPSAASTYNSRAWAYAIWGRHIDKGIEDANRGIALSEKAVESYFHTRGTLLALSGQFGAALEDLNRSVELAPHAALYLYHRAYVWQQLGDPELADADMKMACELDPLIENDINDILYQPTVERFLQNGSLQQPSVPETSRQTAETFENVPLPSKPLRAHFLAEILNSGLDALRSEVLENYLNAAALPPATVTLIADELQHWVDGQGFSLKRVVGCVPRPLQDPEPTLLAGRDLHFDGGAEAEHIKGIEQNPYLQAFECLYLAGFPDNYDPPRYIHDMIRRAGVLALRFIQWIVKERADVPLPLRERFAELWGRLSSHTDQPPRQISNCPIPIASSDRIIECMENAPLFFF